MNNFRLIHENGIVLRVMEMPAQAKLRVVASVEVCATREEVDAKIVELGLANTPGDKIRKLFESLPEDVQAHFMLLYEPIKAMCSAGHFEAASVAISSVQVPPSLEAIKGKMISFLK